jgi:hypothetical protein
LARAALVSYSSSVVVKAEIDYRVADPLCRDHQEEGQ